MPRGHCALERFRGKLGRRVVPTRAPRNSLIGVPNWTSSGGRPHGLIRSMRWQSRLTRSLLSRDLNIPAGKRTSRRELFISQRSGQVLASRQGFKQGNTITDSAPRSPRRGSRSGALPKCEQELVSWQA